MAFNNFNNPRQMFPTQNRGMPMSGQPMRGFQPNQPYGVQGYATQQLQGFPGSHPGYQIGSPMGPQMGQQLGPHINPQMGPQMRPQMGPQMGPPPNTQMGLNIGTFPSNVQLGHQFPKQQQKLIEQQRKHAEEELKKQEELMKKKQLEAERRKLQQSFSAKKPTNADALNNLFGKNKKSAGSAMTDLIGSLGKGASIKPAAASKSTSIFSRPGGSAVHQSNLTPGQWGSGFMSPQGGQGMAKEGHDDYTFGDFSQGPSVSNQRDFNDFQGAQPSTQFGGGPFPAMGSSPAAVPSNISGSPSVFSQSQSWHGTPSTTTPTSSVGVQHSFPATPSQDHVTSYGTSSAASWMPPSNALQGGQLTHLSGEAYMPQTSSISSMRGEQMTFPAGSTRPQLGGKSTITPTQLGQTVQFAGDFSTPQTGSMTGAPMHRGQMPFFMGETSKNRAGSTSEMMPSVVENVPGRGMMSQPGPLHSQSLRNQDGGNPPLGVPPPILGHQGGGFGLGPSHSGAVSVTSQHQPGTQQGFDMSSSLAAPTEPSQEQVPEVEDSPERKLELLYGVALPDWCVKGTDLPGVYKEIEDKTNDATDTIDTNRLFPILMASDLPRDQLGHIWNKANRAVPGQLNALELRIVLGLVALAQAGMKTERLTLEKLASCLAAPIPTIPEHVLQTRGRGWSFTSQEGRQNSGVGEAGISTGRHSSTSSDQSFDPNDKYSVFRAVDQSGAIDMTSSPSMGSQDRLGAFHSHDQPVAKPGPQPNHLPLLHSGVSQTSSGWGQAEVSSVGGSSILSQQQNFGQLQSTASRGTEEEFGDFQGRVPSNNSGPSSFGQNVSQDDFGDFQSEPATNVNTTSVLSLNVSQGKVPDVRNFQAGVDWRSGASSAFTAPENAATVPKENDFGDFQGEKESETEDFSSALTKDPTRQDQVQPQQAFGSSSVGGEANNTNKNSETCGLDLFPKTGTGSTLKSVQTVDIKSRVEHDDFGDFQHSPGPLSTSNKGFTSFDSGGPEKLFSSLEKLKVSSEALSLSKGDVKPPGLQGKKDADKRFTEPPTDEKKENMFADFPAPPSSKQANSSEDRYSVFREADFSSGGGVFSVQKPTNTDNQTSDDGFADFGGFEVADQLKSGNDSDFGAFQSTENVQSASSGVADNFQPAQQTFSPDFGDFISSGGTKLATVQPEKDSNGGFGVFGSFVTGPSAASSNQHHPVSNVGDSLINSVSLEPSERYRVLSHDSGDKDQHTHAWSRCLNSCLLTLATATLAIQKIGEQSVKEEVLGSKEGATYFSAIVEIYRVTLRIKESVNKSAPNNKKLKDIQQEIERTWKDISSFLSGSQIVPPRSSLDFTLHHVSASEDGSVACGICLLNVNKSATGSSKHGDGKLMYGGRQYHSTCANFWCNRVDSVLPSLLPIDSLI